MSVDDVVFEEYKGTSFDISGNNQTEKKQSSFQEKIKIPEYSNKNNDNYIKADITKSPQMDGSSPIYILTMNINGNVSKYSMSLPGNHIKNPTILESYIMQGVTQMISKEMLKQIMIKL